MKPVILHPAAEAELAEGSAYYDGRQRGLGRQLRSAVRAAARTIQCNPKRYPIHRQDTRKVVLHRFPYSIFYIEEDDFIWIAAIAHHRREPDYWTERQAPR